MVNIVNYGQLGGGFRHFAGLQPATPGSGDPSARASVRMFHVSGSDATAMFRGDILVYADSTHGTQGGADEPHNILPPSTSVVIGGGGGVGLGNASMTANVARWTAADTTAIIAGACVGFGEITLYMAKNGFQYRPASIEAWLWVETDAAMEYSITMPTVPGTAYNLILGDGCDVKANAGNQSTRFGLSGMSLDPATFGTTSTLPLKLLSSGNQIGNDPTASGFVCKVRFNPTRFSGFTAD